MRRMWLHLKNLRALALAPPLVLNVLLPFVSYLFYRQEGLGSALYFHVLEFVQYLVPFFSIWWVLFTLREYVEADGNELLFVSRSRGKLPDMLALFALYQLNAALLLCLGGAVLPGMQLEFFRLLCVSVFYFGLVYLLAFLTGSIILTLLAALAYTLLALLAQDAGGLFLQYIRTSPLTLPLLLETYLPLLALGLLLAGAGAAVNRFALRFR